MKDEKSKLFMSARSTANSSANAKLSALFVRTGRILSGEKSDFSECQSGEFTAEQVWKIKTMLAEVKILAGDEKLTLFRGQKIKQSEIINKDRLGPPPQRLANRQRYSDTGLSVLYLSDSLDGVKRELLPTEEYEKLWVIKLDFPIKSLRIANLCDVKTELNDLMFLCELCYKEDYPANGYPSQIFSRAVAKLIFEQFDGFQVFGVRGDEKFRYKNFVLFNHRNWVDWCNEEPFSVDT